MLLTVIVLLEVVHELHLDAHIIGPLLCLHSKEVHLHQFVLRKTITVRKDSHFDEETYCLGRLFVPKVSETSGYIVAGPLRIFQKRPAIVPMNLFISVHDVRIRRAPARVRRSETISGRVHNRLVHRLIMLDAVLRGSDAETGVLLSVLQRDLLA